MLHTEGEKDLATTRDKEAVAQPRTGKRTWKAFNVLLPVRLE